MQVAVVDLINQTISKSRRLVLNTCLFDFFSVSNFLNQLI